MKTITDHDQKIIDDYAEKVASGRTFLAAAESHSSRSGYDSMIAAYDYGNLITALGRFAALGNRQASAANEVLAKVSPYLGGAQTFTAIGRALFKVATKPWDDVVARTGPEPCRYSDAQKPPTLAANLLLAVLWAEISFVLASRYDAVPGPGWCLAALIESERVPVHAAYFPNMAKYLADQKDVAL